MGFFGSLWNGIKKVAETAVVIASAPIIIPAAVAYGVYDSIKNSSSEGSEKVAEVGNLTETSSARQVKQVHEVLTLNNEKYIKIAEATEEGYQKYINDCFAEIIRELKQDETISKSFNMESLLFEQKNLCRQMKGVITRKIYSELTLDNSEIRKIMAVSDKKQRKNRYNNYANGVLQDAMNHAAGQCRKALNVQMEQIDEFLQDYVDSKSKEAERMKNRFVEMERAMENKTFDADKAQLDPKVKLYAVDTIKDILAA